MLTPRMGTCRRCVTRDGEQRAVAAERDQEVGAAGQVLLGALIRLAVDQLRRHVIELDDEPASGQVVRNRSREVDSGRVAGLGRDSDRLHARGSVAEWAFFSASRNTGACLQRRRGLERKSFLRARFCACGLSPVASIDCRIQADGGRIELVCLRKEVVPKRRRREEERNGSVWKSAKCSANKTRNRKTTTPTN